MAPRPSHSLPGLSVRRDGVRAVTRSLPEEWPVALVYDGTTQAVMMASPADLEDFALGFSLTEGVIETPDQVEDFELVTHEAGCEARFWLAPGRRAALQQRRRRMTGPVGCGLCGIDSLEQALRPLPWVASGLRLDQAELAHATDALRARQPLHDQTHAVHAAGFLRPGAGIVLAREDVGRHNALDKLIGAMARQDIDPAGGAIVMTSRISVELVQKCAMAGCPVLIAVSAPTAHAVRLADGAGLTLAAFARSGAFDLYSHPDRIQTGASDVA
ncbi:formate dehydrogenase accessory sulfurtransferase FdhD [Antarcticimicrobium luteum]|uniref:Sulfur carrier protein FdhD n=1 Tax=Antarcticimicrobium luteum TaxID=2547397 RepID=A0A4R5UQZ1_9RHOB|nr:formate dehydrogenase accessory sulfurtransferase FdhD [Antarcticimicrobium luteum]TDK41345.1 formate dehydrogenase accessory sulfurtransferase FdhD [Antarcticimicrobium luteum]